MSGHVTNQPRVGVIGGSGLGQALLGLAGNARGTPVAVETPFGPPSAEPIIAELEGVPVVFLARHGVGHTLSPTHVPYRANVYALKALGCKWVIASGAAGSLREDIHPRDLVLVDQLIDKTTRRDQSFFDAAAVHVEFAEPVCPVLRSILRQAGEGSCASVHDGGTYVCMEGPAFSTRAESLLHRQWGGDLIGMTALPEAKLAREAELSYALVAMATDYDCWRPHQAGQSKQALLEEIISHLHAATGHALALIRRALPLLWQKRDETFPAHKALELAIWSDKSKIAPGQRERLGLIWGRYF